MSSLSKGKLSSNVYPSNSGKSKEPTSKIKTINLNNINNIPYLNLQMNNQNNQNNNSSANTPNQNGLLSNSNNLNNQNSNSFRYTGILSMKFKTTKSSPEKYLNDRNFSGDKGKLLVQNFMKNNLNKETSKIILKR
jgi:hypothetical protein